MKPESRDGGDVLPHGPLPKHTGRLRLAGGGHLRGACAVTQAFAAQLVTTATTVLRLDNMVKAQTLLDEQERIDVPPPLQSPSFLSNPHAK